MEVPVRTVAKDGTQIWRLSNGEIHREDGPAIIYRGGAQAWYLHGKFHREGGPARISSNGRQEWCQNGKTHRLDGPAIIHPDGGQFWFCHDEFHREDGPAVIYADGDKEWWQHGLLHRLDGPAFVAQSRSDKNSWYVHGRDITNEVRAWRKEFEITRPYTRWTDADKALFILAFAGA